MCRTTSQVKLCSGYPPLVAVPLVLHALVPPRPLGTCREIDESATPLWPGSRTTVIPAGLPAANAIGVQVVNMALEPTSTAISPAPARILVRNGVECATGTVAAVSVRIPRMVLGCPGRPSSNRGLGKVLLS